MIYVCMSDNRIKSHYDQPSIQDVVQEFALDTAWNSASNWHMYPERVLSRGEIKEFVREIVQKHLHLGYNQVMLTDSDFIVNEVRIAVKNQELLKDWVEFRVIENGSLDKYYIDEDGRWPNHPDILKFISDQFRRLM